MSVLRSPPGSGLSGSEPNLFSGDQGSDFLDNTKVTLRNKRKCTDDNEFIKEELCGIRSQMSEIMTMITTINTNQKAFMDKISSDVSVIKEQMNDIKLSINNLTAEQGIIKSNISDIQGKHLVTEKKLEALNSEIDLLKTSPATSSMNPLVANPCETIMTEIKEREIRSKNFIIVGIPEPVSANRDQRMNMDTQEVVKVVKTISIDCEPERVIRLGKYNPSKTRPLKVCLKSSELAMSILRNKDKIICDHVKVFSDQTPQQQAYRNNLKDELKRQSKNGINNLTIKYIKGIPKIIEIPPKN